MTDTLPAAVVDTFTSRPHAGNPAAVVLLPGETPAAGGPADERLAAVAAELGLPVTAFLRPRDDGSWSLRWFTPAGEADLSAHGTVAAAHWLWERGLAPDVEVDPRQLTFRTHTGATHVVYDVVKG